jgi:polyhydroxyalkanoate synthesis repressor PhaR
MMTVIKRYQNRKLYDVEQSRYVTTDDLARMIREGQTVRVIDHETDDDITPLVLTNVLKQSDMSASLLHHMIRFGAISQLHEDVRQQDLEELERKIDTLEHLISDLVGIQENSEP